MKNDLSFNQAAHRRHRLRTVLMAAVLSLVIGLSACTQYSKDNQMKPNDPSYSSSSDQDASDGLPPMSPDEQAKKSAFDGYALGLAVWLSTQNVDDSNYPDPLVGTWTVNESASLFVFTATEFTWWENKDVLDDNYYKGTYSYMPGAQTNAGYVMDQGEGQDCYSVFLHYKATRMDGSDLPTNYYGMFIVQRLGSPDSIYVMNQRTGGDMEIERVQS